MKERMKHNCSAVVRGVSSMFSHCSEVVDAVATRGPTVMSTLVGG